MLSANGRRQSFATGFEPTVYRARCVGPMLYLLYHSRLLDYPVVKEICSRWIPQSFIKRLTPIGAKKSWKITIAVLQKTFARSSQVTNHGSMRLRPKETNSSQCAKFNESCLWKKSLRLMYLDSKRVSFRKALKTRYN